MKILVMNCGSSSLKYQLIDMENESVLAKGLCERIGIEGSLLAHTPAGGEKYKLEVAMPTHKEAIELVMKALVDPDHGVIQSTDEISAIGHRVVHGGTYYSASVLVDENVKKAIADCFDLAPLHNPANLMGIEACEAAMPGKPNVALSMALAKADSSPSCLMNGKANSFTTRYISCAGRSLKRLQRS